MSKVKKGAPLEEELKSEVVEEKTDAGEEQKEQTTQKEQTQKVEEEAAGIKYLRLMADFQNYKKRVEKEKGDIYAYANEKIVLDLLDVIDNFERALSHQGEDSSVILEGMNKIYKQLKGVLEKNGVEEIEAIGQEFDPTLHNAVMSEDSDKYEQNKVTLIMQKGYSLNKKVIRHTMVGVAK